MRVRLIAAIALSVFLALFSYSRSLHADDVFPIELASTMDGSQDVPPGDPNGFGGVVIWLSPERGTLCFWLRAEGISPPTAAHIHVGEVGVAGPIVVPLVAPAPDFSAGCTAVDPVLLADMAANPTMYYANVHNADFPGGAVRGQLAKVY